MAGFVRRAGRTPHTCLPSDIGPGREIVYPGALRPNLVDYISYDMTDFLQAEGDIVLACPADLESNFAALRYVLQESGKERVFALRPRVSEILTIPYNITNNLTQTIHLLIVRANQRAPLIADDYLRCMAKLVQLLTDGGSTSIHSPILDGEQTVYSLVNLHQALMDLFADANIHVVLRYRVYVSTLSVELG